MSKMQLRNAQEETPDPENEDPPRPDPEDPPSNTSFITSSCHHIRTWWRRLTRPEKLPWTLASLLSILYLMAFVSRVSCDKDDEFVQRRLCWKPLLHWTEGLHGGFCIWGSNTDTGVCPSEWKNSHQFSAYGDAALTLLAIVVGHAAQPRVSKIHVVGVSLLIFLHGGLHWSISRGVICHGVWKHCWPVCHDGADAVEDEDFSHSYGADVKNMNLAMYAIYIFGVVLLDFSAANFSMPLRKQMMLICVITAAWVLLGVYLGAQWALPSVFVQSHVLAAFTGVFADSDMITSLVGWCFLAATMVGATEFLACKSFLLQHYGHVWYDAVLHLSMIASMIPPRKSIETNNPSKAPA